MRVKLASGRNAKNAQKPLFAFMQICYTVERCENRRIEESILWLKAFPKKGADGSA